MTPIFSLQPMLDVPIYGRIATLELFRPHVSISIYFTFRLCVFVVLKSQLNSLMFFIRVKPRTFYLLQQKDTNSVYFSGTQRRLS
jgi:hypothetical protein